MAKVKFNKNIIQGKVYTKKAKKGDQCSENFVLDRKIKSLEQLSVILKTHHTIFWNFKVFPTAFFLSWQFRTADSGVKKGLFWTVTRIKKTSDHGNS